MKALYIVDVQNDFLPGGSLAVPNGDEVVPVILDLIDKDHYDEIFVSEDWHPYNHTSFAENHNVAPFTMVDGEMKWPIHCVQYSMGACLQSDIFYKLLKSTKMIFYLQKGDNDYLEEYTVNSDQLSDELCSFEEVDVVGLATDHCVKHTALALKSIGLKVNVILAGCRGVSEETTNQAIKEMEDAGITVIGE